MLNRPSFVSIPGSVIMAVPWHMDMKYKNALLCDLGCELYPCFHAKTFSQECSVSKKMYFLSNFFRESAPLFSSWKGFLTHTIRLSEITDATCFGKKDQYAIKSKRIETQNVVKIYILFLRERYTCI